MVLYLLDSKNLDITVLGVATGYSSLKPQQSGLPVPQAIVVNLLFSLLFFPFPFFSLLPFIFFFSSSLFLSFPFSLLPFPFFPFPSPLLSLSLLFPSLPFFLFPSLPFFLFLPYIILV